MRGIARICAPRQIPNPSPAASKQFAAYLQPPAQSAALSLLDTGGGLDNDDWSFG
jgi:hypothetical protein